MTYKIIWSSTIQNLETKVNEAIKEGYKPFHGLAQEKNFYTYYQIMIKD